MKVILLALAMAGSWPQWHGPARNGHATGFDAPAVWPKALEPTWTAEIGEGYSSPVADSQRVCALARQGDDEVAACFARDSGKELWSDRYRSPFQKNTYAMRMAPAPFSTPLLHEGTLYTLGANATLSAYDAATGKRLWRREPPARPSVKNNFCGTAMSPMIDEGRLIVFWGDDMQGELIALAPATGKTIWSAPSLRPAYASVAVGIAGGVRQYVALTTDSVAGVEPATGKVLWTYPFPDQWHENIITPVIDGGRVLVSGVRSPTMMLEPVKGRPWSVKVAWKAETVPLYMSHPVLADNLLYGLTSRDKGKLFTLDPRTGVVVWSSEGRFASQAALAAAGKWLLVTTDQGELIVLERNGGKPIERARYELSKTAVYAQPALAGRQIVIKDERTLRSFLVP